MSLLDDEITKRRELESFTAHCEPIAPLLSDEGVIDIMLNAPQKRGEPGEVWVDRVGVGLEFSGVSLTADQAMRIIRSIGAEGDDETPVDAKNPVLSAQSELGTFRFEALIPPASLAPTFTIRKYIRRDVSLVDYVESGELTLPVMHAISEGAEQGLSILVAGETGAGKTTVLNALLKAAAANGHRRMLIIEDTAELECPPGPSSRIKVNPKSGFTYREGVQTALRQRPNTIVLGEMRRPDDASEAVEAWNTGHQGMGTLHAPSCTRALWRLYSLCRQSEGGRHVEQRTIADAVQLVIHVSRVKGRRRIVAKRVAGWAGDDFVLTGVVDESD
jgi:type IV secretion system protein VirB11